MIRVKDIEASLNFYQNLLGFTLIDKLDFPQWEFCVYFLQSLPKDSYDLVPGSDEAHKFLFSTEGVTVELTYNYGTEKDAEFSYHTGNAERDGFGHLAVACPDVYAACEQLEAAGVSFKKKPDEGRMKGLAFAYDPDGYWIEIITRGPAPDEESCPQFMLAQTMLRVKDPEKSVPFYQNLLQMKLVRVIRFDSFSLFFLATVPDDVELPDPEGKDAGEFVRNELYPKGIPVLELTHNHGTENDPDFQHYNGNTEPRKGFGHIGYLVDDVYEASEELEKAGVAFKKKPDDGGMKGLAFALDPDGYWIEILKRGHDGKTWN
jgi:lactoylglutathione lyase